MKKKRKIIMFSAIGFIAIVCLQVFKSGHKHVVVVEENISLTEENKALTNENKGLKQNVSELKQENTELSTDSQNIKNLVNQVVGKLDSTNNVVKKIKIELSDEKDKTSRLSNGEQFDFQPIKLPTEDDN